MNDPLIVADVDGVKLVTDENNFASLDDVRNRLEYCYQQGSQGWGVDPSVAVDLTLARELRGALDLAAQSDENFRMLKGAQMETGRLKKRIDKLEAQEIAYELQLTELKADLEAKQRSNDVLAEQVNAATAERIAAREPATVIESHGPVDNDE